MQSHIAKPPTRSLAYTKFSTPLVLEPPQHCGLPTIRLGLGRHLLGTDSQCTVRVRADNVEPRHALIVVSEHRTVVKALHPQTWINEGPVSEMALRPGDRLSLGPLTFRVRAARADELEGFEASNTGTFDDDGLFPSDDLLNRNASTGPSWRVGTSSGQAHASPKSSELAPSMFRTLAPAVAVEAVEHHRVEVLIPVERSLAAHGHGVGETPESGIAEPKVVAPVFHSPVVIVPSVASSNSTGAIGHVKASAWGDGVTAGVTGSFEPVEPVQRGGAGAARPTSTFVSSTPALDLQLDEISHKLAELNRPLPERPSTPDDTAARLDSLAIGRRDVVEQQAELRKRADELARQTEQVQERIARVEEREAEAQRQHSQLIHEHEQLRITKDATRRELAKEYARHQKLRQEWDTSYRRTSAELNEQLQSLEQRRALLSADADRLNLERSDIQRTHAELERDRRELAALRSQLSNDHLTVKSLRMEFAGERQQHLAAIKERDAQVAQERLATIAMQSEVLAARQQFERDRAELMTERVAAASIRERERFELTERREQLEQEQARLQADRIELDNLRRAGEAARTRFEMENATVPSQPSAVTTDDTERTHTRERLRQVETELLQSGQQHLATNFVAAPFTVGTLGTGARGLGPSEAEVLRGSASQSDADVHEPFVDPYAYVDLPPLVVGNPQSAIAQTGDLNIAEPPAFNALDWESSYGIDSNDRHESVAGDRFVDPYADVQLPSPDLFHQTVTVEEESNELAQLELDSPDISEWATDPTHALQSQATFDDDTQAVATQEENVADEYEPMPLVLSSPDGERPDEESLGLNLPPSDDTLSGMSQDHIIPSEESIGGDAQYDNAVVEELELDDAGEDDEGASNSLPFNTVSISDSSPSSTGSEPKSYRFWEDDSLYDTSQSATEIPVFDSSSTERMSDKQSALQGTAPLSVAASLNPEQAIPNGESEENFSSGDSVEIWCRSFDRTDAEPAAERELFETNDTATATLDESLSIDETLAEVNRVFGVLLPATANFEFEPASGNAAETGCAAQESFEFDATQFDAAQTVCELVDQDQVETEAEIESAECGQIQTDKALLEFSEVAPDEALQSDFTPVEYEVRRDNSRFAEGAAECAQSEDLSAEASEMELFSVESSVREAIDFESESVQSDIPTTESAVASLTDEEHMALELTDIEIPVVDFSAIEAAFAESCFTKPAVEEFLIPEVTDTESEPEPEIGSACGASERPAWWKECESSEIPVCEGPRYEDDIAREIAEGLIAVPDGGAPPQQPVAEASSDPLASLRAQLAQMFDMKSASPASSEEDGPAETSLEDERSDDVGTFAQAGSDRESPESLNESSLATSDEENTADEVLASHETSETSTESSPIPEASQASTSVAEDEDDSVENYMARLLSRSRGGATVSPKEAKSLAVSATRASGASADGPAAAEEIPFDPADRSHLTAGPKHKQDRQAVRDHLQSFRQVAHQSARSALARHTTKLLLSTLIAKTVLLSVSTAAAAFYFGAPLIGWPTEIWNGAACSLAALLSGMEFYRSWSKFRQSFSHGKSPNKKAPRSEVAEMTPATEVAVNDVV